VGQRQTIRAMLSVPVRLRRKVVGVLTVTSGRTAVFGRSHARLLGLLAAMVAIDLEHARLEALATRDPLTGIANRRRFDDTLAKELAGARASKRPVAVAIFDLDHFKSVNDRFGHAAGDAVLKQAVARWSAAIRSVDLLARIGGEEFGLLLPGASISRAEEVAERLRKRIRSETFHHGKRRIAVTCSVGVAVAPNGAAAPARLLIAADRALYRAKRAGRDCVKITAPS
jgi:diguanylate cyclase (GGDEF)-like protein